MNARSLWSLTEPQQRRLTVALASLERVLAQVRGQLQQAPADLHLTRYEDRLKPEEAPALLPAIQSLETHLQRLVGELGLSPMTESIRRGLVAGLELASIHLQECRPGSGLKGYGAIAPDTAQYLERELPKLEAAVRRLAAQLGQPEWVAEPGPND